MSAFVRKLNHPVLLVAITLVCVVMWMPFGMGYYGWPWEDKIGRIGIQVGAFSFLIIAATAIVASVIPEIRILRLALSILALVASLYGLFALYSWKDRYLEFVRQRDSHTERRPNKAPEPTRSSALSFRKITWTSNIDSRVAHL
jgi:hypothetical protein